MNCERGSASIIVAGVAVFAILFGLLVADVGIYLRGRATASTAADAAALAAAPLTFASFGSERAPHDEAARFAEENGALLVWCDCPVDRTWRTREVGVLVTVPVRTILFGQRSVPASSRAEFVPTDLPNG